MIFTLLTKATTWMVNRKTIKHLLDDLSSLRALWNHIMLILFCASCVFCILTNPAVHGTVITVLGGVATAIFSGYVFSTTYERVKKNEKKTEPVIVKTKEVDENEKGAEC